MTYMEKKAIADAYLEKIAGVGWDDLSDVNSLHDAHEQEDIFALCEARLSEDGFRDSDDFDHF